MLMEDTEDGVRLCRGCGLGNCGAAASHSLFGGAGGKSGISGDGSSEVGGMQKEVMQTWEAGIKLAWASLSSMSIIINTGAAASI